MYSGCLSRIHKTSSIGCLFLKIMANSVFPSVSVIFMILCRRHLARPSRCQLKSTNNFSICLIVCILCVYFIYKISVQIHLDVFGWMIYAYCIYMFCWYVYLMLQCVFSSTRNVYIVPVPHYRTVVYRCTVPVYQNITDC
jgi:hypothetical protein